MTARGKHNQDAERYTKGQPYSSGERAFLIDRPEGSAIHGLDSNRLDTLSGQNQVRKRVNHLGGLTGIDHTFSGQ